MSEGELISAAGRALGRGVSRARRVAGGDINEAHQIELDDGTTVFLKSRAGAPDGEFAAEAAGLGWLAEAEGLPVPEILAVVDEGDARGLALEWIEPGYLDGDGEEDLGRGLAIVHRAGAPSFGSPPPGSPHEVLRFGSVELPLGAGSAGESWAAHYGERLGLLASAARDGGGIDAATSAAVDRVVDRMEGLAGPEVTPARVHGDLWSGNVHAGSDGRPWLIDPAAHGGHPEIDLAMLRLFGSVSARTLDAYEDVQPLAEDHEQRVALWQLQPLLVHAILFGGSYGASVRRAAAHYL